MAGRREGRDGTAQLGYVIRKPAGPAGLITAWYAEATTVLDLDGRPRLTAGQHRILESAVGADGFPVR